MATSRKRARDAELAELPHGRAIGLAIACERSALAKANADLKRAKTDAEKAMAQRAIDQHEALLARWETDLAASREHAERDKVAAE